MRVRREQAKPTHRHAPERGSPYRSVWRALCASGILLLWLVALPTAGLAQAPDDQFVEDPAGAPGGEGGEGDAGAGDALAAVPGEQFTKFEILSFAQMSYRQHPFLQITGTPQFRDGKSATNVTSLETPTTADDEDILSKAVHSLPPFSVETGTTIDLDFPRTISVGFDYTRISQTDKDAFNTSKSAITVNSRILMDSYYYVGFVRGYAFDAGAPGLNYYLGIGIGLLNGKIRTSEFGSVKTTAFEQSPFGVQQLGLEVLGENYGFRYEIRLISARDVKLDENPLTTSAGETEINFSGTMTRLSLIYKF